MVNNDESPVQEHSDSDLSSRELFGLIIVEYNAFVVVVVGTTPMVSFSPSDSKLSRDKLINFWSLACNACNLLVIIVVL